MNYKLYAIMMYGTDEEKLKLFKTRQNYLSYKLYVMSGLFSKYTLLYSREVREIQRELNQVNNICLRLEYKLIGRWFNEI